jgi:hypothetical protein
MNDGTPVIGVHLYDSGSYAASLAASQAMANDIVRRLEALGIPRGRVLPFGFGANRRIAAMNRARARHTPSRVDLFVVPAAPATATVVLGPAQPNAPVMSPAVPIQPVPQVVSGASTVEQVSALAHRVRGSLLACTATTRDLALAVTFDEQGEIRSLTGPFSAGELRCFQLALANERIAPPGTPFTVGIPLRGSPSAPPPMRSRSVPGVPNTTGQDPR